MTKPLYPELFPVAIGNEEETMLLTGPSAAELAEPVRFVSTYTSHIPAAIKNVPDEHGNRRFTQNGGLVYNGGLCDARPILERATPECATPSEAASYMQANEKLLVNMLGNYVVRLAQVGKPEVARAHRRVVDSYKHTQGCHDNFEVRDPIWLRCLDEDGPESAVLLEYLEKRSFMTGAGYVTDSGLRYAQKVEHTGRIRQYGFVNSAYRISMGTDTGPRLEVRCNDINISPWATQVRVGGTALLLSLLQTPLARRMTAVANSNPDDQAVLNDFRRFNHAAVDAEGRLHATHNNMAAVDYQERMLEMMDDELGEFIDINDEYRTLIHEMRQYCEDYKKVMHGQLDLIALSDRSDMAAKFTKIANTMHKERDLGLRRSPNDTRAKVDDLRYDHISVKAGNFGKPLVEYGYGYRLRDKSNFRLPLRPDSVERAYYLPPKTTRAAIRGLLIRQDKVEKSDWSWLSLKLNDGVVETVSLPRVMLPPQTVQSGDRAASNEKI